MFDPRAPRVLADADPVAAALVGSTGKGGVPHALLVIESADAAPATSRQRDAGRGAGGSPFRVPKISF
jgi:hypothetical protein